MRAFTYVAIALIAAAMSVPFAGSALAQAGSTGGTVGNRDKSVSGSNEPTAPASPHRHTPSRKSADTRASTSGGCGPILGKWLWFNGVTVVVNADRTTTQSDGHSASVACTDGVYRFNWGFGSATMTLSADGRRMTGRDSLGSASASRE
jgi:hypothetical protein